MKKFLILIIYICFYFIANSSEVITHDIGFNKDYSEIYWDLRVLQKNGNTFNNLKNSDFKIFYRTVSDKKVIYDLEPISVSIVMDSSNSVKDVEKEVKDVFFKLMEQVPENSDRMYVKFNNRVDIFKKLTDSEPSSWKNIENLKFSGSSALYDSIYYSARALSRSLYKKYIIVISDGIDEVTVNSSKRMSAFSKEHALSMAIQNNVKIISYCPDSKRKDIEVLKDFSERSGGIFLKSDKKLKSYFKDELRQRFSVIFEDPLMLTESLTREVNISINYKGDTLNVSQVLNKKNNKRFMPVEKISYYDKYKITLEDVIVDYPRVNFIMYSYYKDASYKAPSEDDIKVTVGAQIVPFEMKFQYDDADNIILIDKSGSMKDQWQKTGEFLARFINNKKYFDTFNTILFDSSFSVLPPLGNMVDIYKIRNRIVPSGSTAFYDSLIYSLMQLEDKVGHKSIIAFTDGKDSRYEGDVARLSKYSLEDVKHRLKFRSVPLYIINYSKDAKNEELSELAVFSGGAYFFRPSEKSISVLYDMMHRDHTGMYRIRFKYPRIIPSKKTDLIEIFVYDNTTFYGNEDYGFGYPELFVE